MMDIVTEGIVRGEEDAMRGRFLTFLLGEETYGIEIKHVMEIIGMQPITEMPDMPEYVKGIINLRGSIIPAMDARLRFKKPEMAYTDRTCMIVISFGGTSMGLIVDCVSEVLTIADENLAEKPDVASRGSRGYVKNIGKMGDRIVLLIDCEKLLGE
ncbi:MAG: chemotaxis protein CheW [Lawsonibacter sp.]|nr:chemotaxis protein CheW [Lawsonibacter sp.]